MYPVTLALKITTRSNAKALDLIAGNNAALDGAITFSTAFAFDFDRSNGINGSQIDFVSVAAHEIGHLLGFTSGVDVLDGNGPSWFFLIFSLRSFHLGFVPIFYTKYCGRSRSH